MSHVVTIYGTKDKDDNITLTTEGYVKLPNGTYKKMSGLTPIIRIPEDDNDWPVVYKKDENEFDKLYKKSGKLMRQLPTVDLETYLLTEDNNTVGICLDEKDEDEDEDTGAKWVLSDEGACYSVIDGEIDDRMCEAISGDYEIVKIDDAGDLLIKSTTEKFYREKDYAEFYEAVTIDGETNEPFEKSFKIDPSTAKKAIALAKKFAKDIADLGLGLVVDEENEIHFMKLPTDLGYTIEGDCPSRCAKKYIDIPDEALINSEVKLMPDPCIILGDADNPDEENDDEENDD